MATVSLTLTKFIAGIIIAILASSAISIGVSTMLITGTAGIEGPQGDMGPQGPEASGDSFSRSTITDSPLSIFLIYSRMSGVRFSLKPPV